MTCVAILGAGAFGTALAISLARDGTDVTLWARAPGDMQHTRENTRRLPGFAFPDRLRVTGDLAEAARAETLLLALPLQQTARFLADNRSLFRHKTLVACAKGIDIASGRGPAEIISETCPGATPAVLSGPSFAVDIAAGLPTALTLAAAVPEPLQHRLSTANLRLYRTTDLVGVEIGGALKNVIAIACGVAIGAGLGESARAAVMTRGFAELRRFARARGARPETLTGLSGFGDLTLSCSSAKSRNFAFGHALGQGASGDRTQTIEGIHTARAVHAWAQAKGIDMPITDSVCALVKGGVSVDTAINALLMRPLTEE